MSKIPKGDSLEKPSNKNIKNIYVHKINSLMKISRENLGTDQIQIIHNTKGNQKKIKKIYSESTHQLNLVDKATLKLEKNRQSARKARQRKNLYIKLLENQVQFLKKQLSQSETVQQSSQKYLNMIKSTSKPTYKHSHSPTVEDDLDKYISQDNVADIKQCKQRDERKVKKLDDVLAEFKHWFVPDLLKNITTLKKQERIELNAKMLKIAEQQHQKIPIKQHVHYAIKNNNVNHNHHEFHKAHQIPLHMLLPLEQDNPQQKISSVVKNLYKNSQQVKALLDNLGQLNKQIKQLITQQETTDLQAQQMTRKRIRSIIQQLKLCGVGDRPQKIIQRIMRWSEFPSINMHSTMHKIVQLNKFIENTYVQETQMNQIKQRDQESEMSEQKQTDKPKNH